MWYAAENFDEKQLAKMRKQDAAFVRSQEARQRIREERQRRETINISASKVARRTVRWFRATHTMQCFFADRPLMCAMQVYVDDGVAADAAEDDGFD